MDVALRLRDTKDQKSIGLGYVERSKVRSAAHTNEVAQLTGGYRDRWLSLTTTLQTS